MQFFCSVFSFLFPFHFRLILLTSLHLVFCSHCPVVDVFVVFSFLFRVAYGFFSQWFLSLTLLLCSCFFFVFWVISVCCLRGFFWLSCWPCVFHMLTVCSNAFLTLFAFIRWQLFSPFRLFFGALHIFKFWNGTANFGANISRLCACFVSIVCVIWVCVCLSIFGWIHLCMFSLCMPSIETLTMVMDHFSVNAQCYGNVAMVWNDRRSFENSL